MKLVARHADGTKSEWQMETTDHTFAIEVVSTVIMAETCDLPNVVLALIEGGKTGWRKKQEKAMRLVKHETTKPIQMGGIESLELIVAKQKETMKVNVPKPRNYLVVLAITKKAGKHKDKKREMKHRHIEEHD